MKEDLTSVTEPERRMAAEVIKGLRGAYSVKTIALLVDVSESYIHSIQNLYRKPDGSYHCPPRSIRKVLEWISAKR